MSVKVIVFDYGGVICLLPSPEMRNELVRLSGLSAEVLWELDRKYRGEWDRGTYDGIGHYRLILAKAGVSLEPQPSPRGEGSPLEPQPSPRGEGSPLDRKRRI